MVFIFERGATVVELETRFDNATQEYILELREPSKPEQVERFQDAESFRTRLLETEDRLAGQKWRRTGPPILQPDGWPIEKPRK